jgi:hypothetical protein
MDALLAKTDTRVLAGRWLAARVRPDEAVYDSGGVYAGVGLLGVRGHVWRAETFDASSGRFADSGGRLPEWLVIPESPLVYGAAPDRLRRLAADRYTLVKAVPATDPGISRTAYDEQDAFFLPMASFGAVRRPGPTVRIYRKTAER